MGPQRVLQAIAAVAIVAAVEPAATAAPRSHERIAVVDLGPGTAAARISAAVVAAGMEPLTGDGVEDALAGRNVDRDAGELAAALAAAQRGFGELKCSDAAAAAHQAIGLAAARQAAGLPAPELNRAWTYVLLCADRDGALDAAATAATRLRALGGSPDVPAGVWAKYPAVDVVANLEVIESPGSAGARSDAKRRGELIESPGSAGARSDAKRRGELIDLDIDTEVPGAEIWIDFVRAGVAPLHIALPAGEHVIAAAAGTRRGWAAGVAVRSQKSLRVPLRDPAGPSSDVARRVAGWNAALPGVSELAWLLGRVDARIALVRHGDTVEAWGQVGRSELPHRLAGPAPITELERVLGGVAARVRAWDDHAPDPDRPLLTEASEPGGARSDTADRPTKWWVYAAIAGAATVGAIIIFSHDAGSDRQRVELTYP